MKIYNTLSRKKEDFVPIKKGAVGMYVCGPTVYDEPHIGHARSAYIFDVVRRYFEYSKFKVKFVRNVTDVDDKIIDKARSAPGAGPRASNLKDTVGEISEKYLRSYHDAIEGLLGIKKPTREPRATKYIPKMIKFIEYLVKNGCAYEAGGDVYFDIKKAKNYGKLSGQNLENLEAGARISPGEKKRGPMDFALWKKGKADEPAWPSPWGDGRPGWHIECSAMSSDILGDEFDIHAGGLDLIFPHHENEIAQSEGAGKKFARYWAHNGLLTINGEKMAKSKGNFITIKDFEAKHKDPDALKLFFLSSHYRSPADYTEAKIREAARMKERIAIFVGKVDKSQISGAKAQKNPKSEIQKLKNKFIKAMDDDFNTPEALGAIFELVNLGNIYLSEKKTGAAARAKDVLLTLTDVLGISPKAPKSALGEREKKLIKEREKARHDKDFEKADRIRKELLKKGIILEDVKTGTEWRRKL